MTGTSAAILSSFLVGFTAYEMPRGGPSQPVDLVQQLTAGKLKPVKRPWRN